MTEINREQMKWSTENNTVLVVGTIYERIECHLPSPPRRRRRSRQTGALPADLDW